MFRSPMRVKSQDPSPQDAAANLRYYEESRRRSVYLPVVRTNVYGFLTLFDFPNVATHIGRRDETNVPTQALWMFNSSFINHVSSRLAEKILSDADSTEAGLNQLFERILSRVPSEQESQAMQQALESFAFELADADQESREREAWAMLVQALYMSAEAMDAP